MAYLKTLLTAATLCACIFFIQMTHAANTEILRSWNEGDTKARIVAFVNSVTTEGSPDFIPVPRRIAVFDNDGTLWSEQPYYTQLFFIFDRIRALAPQHPEWRGEQSFKAALEGDVSAVLASGERGLCDLMAATHSGITKDEFKTSVRNWISTARHPRYDTPFTQLAYLPMLELLRYLHNNDFKIYIVSGGGVEFIRAWSEKVYGIPEEQVIGSPGTEEYEMRNGRPVILKLDKPDFITDGDGKSIAIQKFIGRRPVMAFGNSDSDLQMLQWTDEGEGPNFMALVHHTDEEREYAYDRESRIGKLDKALDKANAKGWTIIDMKQDWKKIFVNGGRS